MFMVVWSRIFEPMRFLCGWSFQLQKQKPRLHSNLLAMNSFTIPFITLRVAIMTSGF